MNEIADAHPPATISVFDLLSAGDCDPSCLLALNRDSRCACACGGQFHGALTEAVVSPRPGTFAPTPGRARRLSAAPPIPCFRCGREIGAGETHWLLPEAGDAVLCAKCMNPRKYTPGTGALHREIYPECEVVWHDMHDHALLGATRAFAAYRLGLWS